MTHLRPTAELAERALLPDDPGQALALTTNAGEPVIDPAWLRSGAHVSSVGYKPPGGELPRELAASGHLFVETRRALAPPPVGCAELAGLEPSAATELGELLLAPGRGRADDREITVYKAMGHVMEDLVAGSPRAEP